MGKGGKKFEDYTDDEQAGIVFGGCLAWTVLTIYIVGGLLNLIFATCATGECADGSCWWGCDCGYYGSDSPASGVVAVLGDTPAATLCTGSCVYTEDGECDDGRAGSDTSLCSLGTDCYDCDYALYSSSSRSSSTGSSSQCPSGHLCSGGFVQDCASRDELCEPGTYCPTAGCTECLPCPAGTFCPNSGCAECQACPVGEASMAGATACSVTLCDPGYYADGVACLSCDAGRFSNQNAASAAECLACDDHRIVNSTSAALCSGDYLHNCPSNPGGCPACTGQSDCESGEYCGESGFCDVCENMMTRGCQLMGGDCCSQLALSHCPEAVDTDSCTFCRGDIVDCALTFSLGFGWLLFIGILTAFVAKILGFGFSKPGLILLALLFLVPKAAVVGISLAHSKTAQFTNYSPVYPLLGFLVVASTMALASACVILDDLTSRKARKLLALLSTVLHTILSISVTVHVIIAWFFSSQRELSLLHVCIDLSQLFALHLIAAKMEHDVVNFHSHDDEVPCIAAAGVLWDSGNVLYLALLGMWIPWPGQGGFIATVAIWLFRQMVLGSFVSQSIGPEDLTTDKVFAMVMMLATISVMILTVALISCPGPPPGGYFPVCVILAFLPHIKASPIQLAYAGFASVACWWSLSSANFILAHVWFSAFVMAVGYASKLKDMDDMTLHRATLLPVMIHALFVMGSHLRDNSSSTVGLTIGMIGTDVVYCMVAGWLTLEDTASSTSFVKWIFHWVSLVTTGIAVAVSGLSGVATTVGMVLLAIGGVALVEALPHADTSGLSSKVAAFFVLLQDAVPVLYFISDAARTMDDTMHLTPETLSSGQATSLMQVHQQGTALPTVAIYLFIYKAVVCLWYSVFELKANWGNTTRESWVPWADKYFIAAWTFLVLHGLLTSISAIDGIETNRTISGTLTDILDTSVNATSCSDGPIGEVAHADALAGDTFRCASPADMLTANAIVFLGVAISFMLLVGEYINKTRGDVDRTWADSWTAKIAENLVQMLLTSQVLYCMLRLRTQPDALCVCFVTLDLLWIFLLMLSRQLREGYDGVTYKDWGVMYLLEAWDVVNSLIVTVTIARDTEHDWPTWIADTYVVFFVLTLFLFEVSYPFWTSLKRIAWISCFNDLVTDGPMLYLMVVYELYDKSTVTAIAAFVNICIIAVGVVIWPLKYYIKDIMDENDDDDDGPVDDGLVDDGLVDDGLVDDDDDGPVDDALPEGVTPASKQQLEHFCDATGADKQTAHTFISEAGGDVDEAINEFWNGGGMAP